MRFPIVKRQKLVKLEIFFSPKKSSHKILVWKEIKEKENGKCSYGNIWWLIIVVILLPNLVVLVWSTHCLFFRRIVSRLSQAAFFGFAAYKKNISMSQVEINLVFQHVLLSRTTIANSKKYLSVFTHQASLLLLPVLQVSKFAHYNIDVDDGTKQNEHVNLRQLVLRITRQGSITGTLI